MAYLHEPPASDAVQAMYDDDMASYGFVMDLVHVWAHLPDVHARWADLLGAVTAAGGFSVRERGILITAAASTIGDSYCSIAWGWKLGKEASPDVAAAVLSGTDEGLSEKERAMAAWARKVAGRPAATTEPDVQALRDAGWDETQIFAMTAYVGFRIAFSTINASLGAAPDPGLAALASPQVRETVTWGRPVGG